MEGQAAECMKAISYIYSNRHLELKIHGHHCLVLGYQD